MGESEQVEMCVVDGKGVCNRKGKQLLLSHGCVNVLRGGGRYATLFVSVIKIRLVKKRQKEEALQREIGG